MKKRIALFALLLILLSSCATSYQPQRPTYQKGQDLDQYHKKLQKHYQQKQAREKFIWKVKNIF